jgi:hypothetical protein
MAADGIYQAPCNAQNKSGSISYVLIPACLFFIAFITMIPTFGAFMCQNIATLDIALLPSRRVACCFSATILAGDTAQLSIVHRNKDIASHKGICYRLRQMRLPYRTA